MDQLKKKKRKHSTREQRIPAPEKLSQHPGHLKNWWKFWYYQTSRHMALSSYPSKYPLHILTPEPFESEDAFEEQFELHMANPISRLIPGESFLMFKKDIEPYAYDPYNKDGGQWTITFWEDDLRINESWKELLLCMVTNKFVRADINEICGAVITRGKVKNHLQIWTKNRDASLVYRIMDTMFSELKLAYLLDDILYHEHFHPFGLREQLLIYRTFSQNM